MDDAACQGREKEIIIFSAVRSRKGARIGFVADERRINVGLTRAQSSLLLVGQTTALSRDPRWCTLVDMATDSRCPLHGRAVMGWWN